MSDHRPLRSFPAGTFSGSATVLRPDFAARRRAVLGSPAHLAAQADVLFARMMARRQSRPTKPGAAEAALAALAAAIDLPEPTMPAPEAASWQPCRFVDPSAGLTALSASLSAVTHPRVAL